MNLIEKIKIKRSCNEVGIDEFGNKYFEEKIAKNSAKKRFVIYKGIVEPSKIPSEWHGWIHYSQDKAPVNSNTNKHPWQKIHLPNLTGKIIKKAKKTTRKKVSSDYESWQPNRKK